jgi:serine/threonine-protein kinase
MDRLGRYRLIRRVATGGMGELFLAESDGPGGFSKEVAIKRLLPHLAADAKFTEQFLNEARLAALLNHPNVVQVFELGESDGAFFLAMEYVSGKSLRSVLDCLSKRGETLDPLLAARITADVLSALAHAHGLIKDGQKLRIVHRDVSPENVLLSFDGAVKVVDFGIAKAADARGVTRVGAIRGKLPYIAPERLEGGASDPAVDIYGAGALLFEALEGTPPFSAPSEAELLERIMKAPTPRLGDAAPAMLAQIVQRALQRSPKERFASADSMAKALVDFIESTGRSVGAERIAELMSKLFAGGAQAEAVDRGTEKIEPEPPTRAMPGSQTLVLDRKPIRRSWAIAALGIVLTTALAGVLLRSRPVPLAPAADPTPATSTIAELPPPAPSGEPARIQIVEPERRPIDRPPRLLRRHLARTVQRAALAAPGRVQIYVKPWAEVFWQGRRIGITPLPQPIEVPSGDQVFTLKNNELGVTRALSLKVPPAGTTTLKVDLLSP